MRGLDKPGKGVKIGETKGVMINQSFPFEDVDSAWADQLAIYCWCLGEKVGVETIIGIDQIACKPSGEEFMPYIRVASHRNFVSKAYQLGLLDRAQKAWAAITDGWYFKEMTKEDSKRRTDILDTYALGCDEYMHYEETMW